MYEVEDVYEGEVSFSILKIMRSFTFSTALHKIQERKNMATSSRHLEEILFYKIYELFFDLF